MALDLEHMMILLQRRYNTIREIGRLTDELSEAVYRNDQVSSSMILQMRADEMGRCDACFQEIWALAEAGPEEAELVRRLMTSDSSGKLAGRDPAENKIYEIRRKTGELLEKIRQTDRRMSQRVGGEKSFYARNKI